MAEKQRGRKALFINVTEDDHAIFKAAALHERLSLTSWVRSVAMAAARKVLRDDRSGGGDGEPGGEGEEVQPVDDLQRDPEEEVR